MESPQAKKKVIEQNKFKRTICKNAIWGYEVELTKDETGLIFRELKNTGCKELRQNGSSHCLKCSIKHKQNK